MATQRQKDRKTRTLARLEATLIAGKKPVRVENKKRKKGYSTSVTQTIPHNDVDKKRINGVINNLKKKLGMATATT
jgi:hypothetical protein